MEEPHLRPVVLTSSHGSSSHVKNPPASFQLFPRLPKELKILVLSFVSEASLENHGTPSSSLTHVLPLVSKQFHGISQSNCLWQLALERLVEKEPLWEDALLKLHKCEASSAHDLVQSVHKGLHEPGYFRLYRMVVARFLRLTGPVFIYPSNRVRIGELIQFFFFEYRYRLLIQQVMEGYPQAAREGSPIEAEELPTFIYAHALPVAPSSPACLVQVQRCFIHPDGSAELLLIPVAFLRIERVWEQPDTGGLFYAQCLRVGEETPVLQREQHIANQEGAVGAGRFRFRGRRLSESCGIM